MRKRERETKRKREREIINHKEKYIKVDIKKIKQIRSIELLKIFMNWDVL